ncbi:MAG: TRAP transporter substrate-binding protein DctP [Thermodesulfobacteriota bacterium]|nr:TRAP transporter substrate-binding protein DctP [Thermodesulfobacteriota bacterium]
MGSVLHLLFSRRVFLGFFLAFFSLAGMVSSVCAATLTKEDARAVLYESTQALLSGSPFTPALEQKQQALRETLQSGAIKRAELAAMLEESIVPILEKHRTSRYILKDLPAKFDRLLAPYMEWEEVKAVFWKACAALIPDGQQMMLKIGTLAPSGTPWINIPETMLVPQMAKLSNNKVVIKIYTGGVMGEDTDILRKMDIGQLEGCGCTALGILAASPETAVLLLPGLFNNYDEIDYIYEKFRKRLDSAFEERGYILAALIDTGFFHVYTKNKITGLADLKKQKMLTWFGIVETTLFQELGINATPVAVPEVVSSLSTGLADACLAPSTWMLGMQAYQYVNYYTTPAFLFSPAAVVVSAQTVDRFRKQFGMSALFAANITELLVYEVSTLETVWRRQIRDYEAKTLKAFEAKCGMKPVALSQADRQTLETAAKGVKAMLAGKAFPEDLMNEIVTALENYRAGRGR